MLEVIIALSLAILLGNILAHKIRITPAIMLIFMGLVLAGTYPRSRHARGA